MLLLGAHGVGDAQGSSAGALAVAEDVELGDGQRGDKTLCLVEECCCLSACAHNDIDANEHVGHQLAHALYL